MASKSISRLNAIYDHNVEEVSKKRKNMGT